MNRRVLLFSAPVIATISTVVIYKEVVKERPQPERIRTTPETYSKPAFLKMKPATLRRAHILAEQLAHMDEAKREAALQAWKSEFQEHPGLWEALEQVDGMRQAESNARHILLKRPE